MSKLERALFLVGEGCTAAIVSSVSILERGLFLVGEGVVRMSFALPAVFLGSSAFAVLLLLAAVSCFAVFLVVLRFVACGAFAFGAGGDLREGDNFFLPVRPRLGGDASRLLVCPA